MAVGALLAAAVIAGVIGAAGSIGAQALSNQSVSETNEVNKEINQTNNAFNAEQAQIQRDYETRMSNSAIQRRVADLKAAGLNPMLAVTSGSATTPGAYAATSSGNAQMKAMDYSPLANLSANLGHLVNSAANIKKLEILSQHDPKTMSNLVKVAGSVNKSVTSANRMDRMSVSDLEKAGVGDIVRDHSWLYN